MESPSAEPPKRRAGRPRSVLLRLYRAAVLVAVVLLIRGAAAPPAAPGVEAPDGARLVAEIFYPGAAQISPRDQAKGAHLVADANGNALGYFVLTSPEADDIIGYSGPTRTMVAFGADGTVLGVEVLASGDTEDHLAMVVADPRFLRQFEGKTWEELGATQTIDGVSGATLTSSAIAEGILRRVRGKAPSLRFPKPLALADARRFFPGATALESGAVLGAGGALLGHLLRTSPHADNLIGYRGPSDILIALGPDNETVRGIALRDSYDSSDYVAYLDGRFLALYDGMTLGEIAGAGEVEGVSGATMTSQTVALAVRTAARRTLEARAREVGAKPRFDATNVGTIAVLAAGLTMAFTRLRGNRLLRTGFQLVLIVYFGLINGQLLSQALFAGWAENGVAWQLAPGLLSLAAAALLVPLLFGKNVYCHQICPHGAAQQLLRRAKTQKFAVPHIADRTLRALPFALLLLVVAVAVRRHDFDLAAIEPFDAYLLSAAGAATIAIAAGGLVASLFVPMAYCRYGCPTGALLTFLWAGGRADRFTRRDALALACVGFAAALRLT